MERGAGNLKCHKKKKRRYMVAIGKQTNYVFEQTHQSFVLKAF